MVAKRTARWISVCVTLTVALLCAVRAARALNPTLDVSQYGHTAWRLVDGFPTNAEVHAFAQTPDGYLWLGTDLGLVRFDGANAVRWRWPAKMSLPDDEVRALLASRDGTLWIGTRSGLASWSHDRLVRYRELDGHWVNKLVEDREGAVWVGAGSPSTGLLCAIRGGRTGCYGQDGRFGTDVFALREDRPGNLWIAAQTGLWRWRPGSPQRYPLSNSGDRAPAMTERPNGAVVVLWDNSFYQIDNGKAEALSLPAMPQTARLFGMLADRDGALWIGSLSEGLLHIHDGRIDRFDRNDGLSGDRVSHNLFEDREGNIWVATDRGLDRFRTLAGATYSVRQGVPGTGASVLADSQGGIWYSQLDGLYHWLAGHMSVFRPREGGSKMTSSPSIVSEMMIPRLPAETAASLFEDHQRRIWLGTRSGLGYLDVNRNRFVAVPGIPHGYIDQITEDAAGYLWVAHRGAGLFRLSPELRVDRFDWPTENQGVARLAVDSVNGGMWLGFYSGLLFHWRDGTVVASYDDRDGLGKGPVNHLRVATDGTVWAATGGGLSRIRSGRITTLDSSGGLPCDRVDSSLEENDGSMWLYSGCGLVHIPASELGAWMKAVDRGSPLQHKVRVVTLDSADGVHEFSNLSTYSPHSAQTRDGKIWLLGLGLTVVDTRQLPFNSLPPPMHVERVIADRTRYEASSLPQPLRLPPLVRDLQVDYTALSLVAPEKMQFRYKLEGQDRDWQNVGTRRQAFYTDLSPGNYRFRVIASNNSGVWNQQGAALDFSITPAYWQTLWFRAVCAVAVAGLLWLLYLLRLGQVARAFERTLDARVAERTRIARELHDTLLQSFNGLLLHFAAAARRLRSQPDEAQKMLDETIDQARRAVREGREAVQGLRSSIEEPEDLAEAIGLMAEELSESAARASSSEGGKGQPIAFHVAVGGTRRRKHPLVRDEIYRIATEALRNAFQHSRATQIEVELSYDVRHFRLRVRDNGRGIDPEVLATGAREGHFGLRGMRERAELAGGKLAVWSAPGSGTEVEVTIPAARAYAPHSPDRRDRSRSAAGTTSTSTKSRPGR